MNVKIAFFDAKPYDIESFNFLNRDYIYEIKCFSDGPLINKIYYKCDSPNCAKKKRAKTL
ncbi:MAG TPA: hypothetical protein PK385_08095 [Spirochaetota bacterium]|nr:hypothetical protein [Spirochaetota bacterium]HOS32537.1 hypothetical protein [Spirochaetota bacterium]HOS56005.1 hypothetical protein [Spirochaetota bacterium]HQF76642.1 hypothetical protein [Spirochaetota bacterium]HQH31535.1 hypothetical protein [Spirochaetota bacterium]